MLGGTPAPCTQAEYDEVTKQAKRYAAAEQVYRTFLPMDARELVERVPTPSPELLAMTAGDYAKGLPLVRSYELKAATATGTLAVVWMRAIPVPADGVGSLAMVACTDRTALGRHAARQGTRHWNLRSRPRPVR